VGKHDINAFLGAGTFFTGRLAFEGVVRLDGVFDGEIVSAGGTLIVGSNARVTGSVAVGRLSCGGEVAAEVAAAAKVTVTRTGRLTGSVRTPVLEVEEGGCLEGSVVMDATRPAASAPVANLPAGTLQPLEE
jgi:cytoskeletal protein CcmA (bactofilin family)